VHGSQAQIQKLLAEGPAVATGTRRLLAVNQHKLHQLVGLLHPVVSVLESRQGNLFSAVKQLRLFLLGAARALGHGPWLQVTVAPDLNPLDTQDYTAAECPRYAGVPGKNCPAATAGAKAKPNATAKLRATAQPWWVELLMAPLIALISLLVSP
jgi:hypothetical protein